MHCNSKWKSVKYLNYRGMANRTIYCYRCGTTRFTVEDELGNQTLYWCRILCPFYNNSHQHETLSVSVTNTLSVPRDESYFCSGSCALSWWNEKKFDTSLVKGGDFPCNTCDGVGTVKCITCNGVGYFSSEGPCEEHALNGQHFYCESCNLQNCSQFH